MRAIALGVTLACAGAVAAQTPAPVVIQEGELKDGYPIYVLGDGWTQKDLDEGKFKETVDRTISGLWQIPPYDHYRHIFHIERYDLVSPTHGCMMLEPNIDKVPAEKREEYKSRKTPLQVYWPSVKGAPEIEVAGMNKVEKEILKDRPPGVVVIITPDTEIANAAAVNGKRNSIVLMGSWEDAADSTPIHAILAHEMGHAFFNLGDEYGGPKELPTAEPNAPNVTKDDKNPKWSSIVKTPPVAKGGQSNFLFHPTVACRMNEKPYKSDFCAVCLQGTTMAVSSKFTPIESYEPVKKYVVASPFSGLTFKVKLRGQNRDFTWNWIYDGRSMGAGSSVKNSTTGSTTELTVNVASGGLHHLKFLVEDMKNIVSKDERVYKVPHTCEWYIFMPLPGHGLPGLGVSLAWPD